MGSSSSSVVKRAGPRLAATSQHVLRSCRHKRKWTEVDRREVCGSRRRLVPRLYSFGIGSLLRNVHFMFLIVFRFPCGGAWQRRDCPVHLASGLLPTPSH